MSRVSKRLVWFFIIVSFLGFADATYLTIEHYLGVVPPCLFAGCEVVTTSDYAPWFGFLPVALVGAVYYFIIFFSALLYLVEGWRWGMTVLKYIPVTGFLGSLYFIYLQGFVINAWCQYCLFSAGTSTLLFLASIWLLAPKRSRNDEASESVGRA